MELLNLCKILIKELFASKILDKDRLNKPEIDEQFTYSL